MSVPEPQFDELYREVILDHARRPRNKGVLEGANCHAEGMNPVCGDEVALDLLVEEGRIAGIRFRGQGCSISVASVSLLTERLEGRPVAEAEQVMAAFKAMLTEGAQPGRELGDLEALQGVAKFPVRVKCALLCWNVLREGLQQCETAA
ncbi:MAG: SUF system NifU family Fe-S cluster assembly protein [Dehalococcoidia bacterium]|nr:SUF system NifU family Fe-S cluster assembly protein [Dehalococcoidia bacterium]